jgi:6-pyruvoyltetrahydropterin/6-carboxytetrahydropterin synthase
MHAPSLGPEENRAIYGKCNNPFGHGHNYVLDVGVRGPVDEGTGKAVDLAALDGLVAREIVHKLDHRYLNEEIAEFAELVPTTENLGRIVERRLRAGWDLAFPGGEPSLEKIRIAETDRNIFELAANERN